MKLVASNTAKNMAEHRNTKLAIPREPTRNSKEVQVMFNFKTLSGLWTSIRGGHFPQPDFVAERAKGGTLAHWKLSTLNKEMKRRKDTV